MLGNSDKNTPYRTELTPISNVKDLESTWRALEPEADGSFFVSWSWIGPWLNLPHRPSNLCVFQSYAGDTLVALAILHSDTHYRRRVFRSKTVSINEALDETFNMVIEYNGLLVRRGHEENAYRQLMSVLAQESWDEIKVSHVPYRIYQAFEALISATPALKLHDEGQHSTWIASLDGVTDIDSIIAPLSKNRRWQIRRSIKEYEKEGPLSIVSASTKEQALEFFDRLGVLHTERWNRVGEAGSFANPLWVQFHRAMINAIFDRGEIQILRMSCGERAIGYIYNFVWRKQVLMLQSGFATESSNVLRPGYLSHIFAMQLNSQLGNTHYDFLMGESEYKRVLAKEFPPMTSFRIQRPRIQFTVENALIYIRQKYRDHFAKEKATPSDSAASGVDACITWTMGYTLCSMLRDALFI
ncbi:MAG: GNAT family N-acetyltransferase [Spongiibacteraceae bacterium]